MTPIGLLDQLECAPTENESRLELVAVFVQGFSSENSPASFTYLRISSVSAAPFSFRSFSNLPAVVSPCIYFAFLSLQNFKR